MEEQLVLIDRKALQAELRQVFDARTTETLLNVLDKVAAQVHAAGVTREDFSELRQIVAELAEAQRRSEERLTRLEAIVAELAEAQRRSEERLTRLEAIVAELAEAQRRTEQRVEELAEAQRRTEQRVEELAEAQRRTEQRVEELAETQHSLVDKVGRITGRMLEQSYREKANAYFGRMLLHPQVVPVGSLRKALEARLSADEVEDVLLLDLVVRGKPRRQPRLGEVWLAIEVAAEVDRGDVERAVRRAGLLRRAGYRVVPVVAGEGSVPGVEDEARLHNVVILQDGRSFLWEEALAAWVH